jgi:hypothetical protein
MAKQVNVCSDWNGNANENFDFVNHSTSAVTVDADGESTWPFSPAAPVTVPAKGPGGPGKLSMQILDLPDDTYPYNVDGCLTGGQAKSVTIP